MILDTEGFTKDLVAARERDATAGNAAVQTLIDWTEGELAGRHEADAEEIAGTFVCRLLLLRGLARLMLVEPAQLPGYLRKSLRNFLIDQRRGETRHHRHECPWPALSEDEEEPGLEADEFASAAENVVDAVIRAATRAACLAAVRRLCERDQLLLRLRFVNQLTEIEIGRRLGLERGSVAKRLHDLLLKLRASLAEYRD